MKALKTYLRINSIFSLLSGVIMAHFSDAFLIFFNIAENNNKFLFDYIGLSLILFAFFVWYVSTKQLHSIFLVKLISFLDILWVIGSVIIVTLQLFNLSLKGYIIISVVAIWIGFLAFKQLRVS